MHPPQGSSIIKYRSFDLNRRKEKPEVGEGRRTGGGVRAGDGGGGGGGVAGTARQKRTPENPSIKIQIQVIQSIRVNTCLCVLLSTSITDTGCSLNIVFFP